MGCIIATTEECFFINPNNCIMHKHGEDLKFDVHI